MRTSKLILLIAIVSITTFSCTKNNDGVPAASINVINASPGVSNALVKTPNATGNYSQLAGVSYSSNALFTIPTGTSPVTIASADDTTKPIYSTDVNTSSGSIYSLYIGGSQGNDILLNKDSIPYHTDSTMGVRFINLSYNSTTLNVALVTNPAQNEFTGIAYKSITAFKNYGAKVSDPATYTFQVTDGSGTVIATSADISPGTLVGKNITLVLEGALNGTGNATAQVLIVNNF